MLDTLTSSDIVARTVSNPCAWITVEESLQEKEDLAFSDAELVIRIGAGDVRAEALLYKKFQPGLILMLTGRARDRSRAEDLTQDTLMTVITRLRDRGIDNPEALSRFIQQTAKYIFIGWLRRAGNQVELKESFDDVNNDQTSVVDEITIERRQLAVRDLIGSLKVARDREILHRFYVREQAKPVICEALDLSTEHFDRVINRARNRFKQLVPLELEDDV